MTQTPFSVCVYCGSRTGTNPAYHVAAREVGINIANRQWQLVYGAGSIGLMGVTAQAVLERQGRVVGVIPHHLDHVEITQPGMTETHKTETMHDRKKLMFDRSDAFLVLPGGLGTLDETFEMLTWAQLKLHNSPIIALDVAGFWGPLKSLLSHMENQGFVDAATLEKLVFVDSVDAAFDLLEAAAANREMASPTSRSDLF